MYLKAHGDWSESHKGCSGMIKIQYSSEARSLFLHHVTSCHIHSFLFMPVYLLVVVVVGALAKRVKSTLINVKSERRETQQRPRNKDTNSTMASI